MTEKKVVRSKNDINKSCPKFCILGDEFFYFDKILKIRILQPKNAYLKGAKNHWVKKVIKSKNDLKGVFAIFDVEHMLNGAISNFTP